MAEDMVVRMPEVVLLEMISDLIKKCSFCNFADEAKCLQGLDAV